VIEIPEVNDVDIAFGGYDREWFQRAYDEAPDEFKDHCGTEWNEIVTHWFFNGLNKNVKFYPKEGVDPEKALRAIGSVIGSFQPKHEHKEAVCAYLLSQWFVKIKKWKK
jgi:hypothetical protein